MYKRTFLSNEEIDKLKNSLACKGVTTRRINPKSMHIEDLFGVLNKEQNAWTEGIFTQMFRQFSVDQTLRKKWIQLDGPIDHMWVENMNSILDDNRKMNLPNGETIKMGEGMCLLFECDNLVNVTPATVSRCGLVFMQREEMNPIKQIFNSYLKKLPSNLHDYLKDIEYQSNFLLTEALDVFREEKEAGKLLYK